MATATTQTAATDASDYLQVDDLQRLIQNQGRAIPEIQQLREFFHNMLHALLDFLALGIPYPGSDKPTADITFVKRGGVRKLAFIDNGIGMDEPDMRSYIGKFSASAGRVGNSRYGVGCRLTGLAYNPCGLEYTSMKHGDQHGIRATLGTAVENGIEVYRWLVNPDGTLFTKIPLKDMPESIRKSGHGTQVVLLGETPEEDTFARACSAGNQGKALVRHINEKYPKLPASITLKAHTPSRGVNEYEDRSADIKGLLVALEEITAKSATPENMGVVDLPEATVYWRYTTTAHLAKTRWRNSDNVNARRIVAVCIEDEECAEIVETYDLYTGNGARSVLANFGLADIAESMAIVVLPKNVESRMDRTGLFFTDTKEDFSLVKIAEQFKQNPPARLLELVEEASAGRRRGDNDRLLGSLKKFASLFTTIKASGGTQPAIVNSSGANGGVNPTGAASTGGQGTTSPSTRLGGVGSGPGGRGSKITASAGKDGKEDKDFGIKLADVKFYDPNALEEDESLKDYFAVYFPESDTLFVNDQFPAIDQELEQVLQGTEVSDAQKEEARRDVLDVMIDRVREPIVRVRTLSVTRPEWGTPEKIAQAFTPEAIVAVVMSATSGIEQSRAAAKKAIERIVKQDEATAVA